jgi:hypothetical protein
MSFAGCASPEGSANLVGSPAEYLCRGCDADPCLVSDPVQFTAEYA